MKIIAVNGSPRKTNNTAALLRKALEGAADNGAETKLVHLYDLEYQGCISCFACKRLGGRSFGRCAVRDELTPLLEDVHTADAVVVGTPLYLMAESAMARAFLERLLFQYSVYSEPPETKFPRRIRTALIYTMNLPESAFEAFGVDSAVRFVPAMMERIFGSCEKLLVADTLQFDDYSKYENRLFDPEAKARRHKEAFPLDETKAYALGRRLVSPAA